MAKKFTKKETRYTDDHGDSPEQCSKCGHYVSRTECRVLIGDIVPGGWCQKFWWPTGFKIKPYMVREAA